MPRLLWTQKEDIGPVPRAGASLAYDAARKCCVLVGGIAHVGNDKYRGQILPVDTWQWDGESWVQVADTGPDGRRWLGLAYDTRRERVVLFGGAGASGIFGDTWEWDGQYWTQMADTGPSPRMGAPMIFDERRGRVVLFGGVGPLQAPTPYSAILADTWEWDGDTWSQQEDTGPPPRGFHALAYNEATNTTLLYGGEVWPAGPAGPSATASDTWERANTWVQRADMGPPPLQMHSMVWNGRGVMLFGGAGSPASTPLFKATWEWDGRHWIQRQDMGPPARKDAAMTYDSGRDRVVLFGGEAPAQLYLDDTWELVDNQPKP